MTSSYCDRGGLRRRSFIIKLGGASLVQAGWLGPAWAAPPPQALASAINTSGRFRALSQRLAKAYCQIHLEVDVVEARQIVEAARKLAQKGFDDLARTQWHVDIESQLREARKFFEALEGVMGAAPTLQSIVAVSDQADKMLAAANAATEAFERLSRTSSGVLINTAGRQRYLSQRLAKNYLLVAAGANAKSAREQMLVDAAGFKQGMAYLAASPVTSEAIRDSLLAGERQWIFFSAALDRAPDVRGMRAVATTSERMLEIMNGLAAQYEAAAIPP